ncbi:MAG: cation-translocating P-type ATPase [Pseudomonadota bacterium]
MTLAADGRHEDVLAVDGMFCSSCAAAVERTLERVPGVEQAAVSFAAGAAVVGWHTGAAKPAKLLEAVQRLGYSAHLVCDEGEGSEDAAAAPAAQTGPDFGLRLLVALFFNMWLMLPSLGLYLDASADPDVQFALALAAGGFSLPVLFYSGLPFYRMGWLSLRARSPGIDSLVSLGVLASVGLSVAQLLNGRSDVYFEVAAALITFQLLARVADTRIRRRARDVVLQLLDLCPPSARVVQPDQSLELRPVRDIEIGDPVLVTAGERVAVDGRVRSGAATVDRSALTGESTAQPVQVGDCLRAGEALLDGQVTLEVTAANGQRRIDELSRLVRATLAARPSWQRRVDRLARHFLLLATLAAGVGAVAATPSSADAFAVAERALAVFVIACPCALNLAVPLAGMMAAAAGARSGVVLRDLQLATGGRSVSHVLLDKTGTLTQGEPTVHHVHVLAADSDRQSLLALAAEADYGSQHPLARAIVDAAELPADMDLTGDREVVPGSGVRYRAKGYVTTLGSQRWLEALGFELPQLPEVLHTRVWLALDQRVLGAIDLTDPLRPGITKAIAELKLAGVSLEILSGDGDSAVNAVAATLDVRGRAQLTPEDKVARIAELRRQGATVVFVGDGINDGPAIADADIGVAVAGATDVARTACAVALTHGGADQLPDLLDLLATTRRVARRNLVLAFGYNALAVPFAIAGLIDPVIAAIAMAVSSLTVLANSSVALGRQRPRSTRADFIDQGA